MGDAGEKRVKNEAAKWLRKDELESVNWLAADWEVVKKIRINAKQPNGIMRQTFIK